MPETKTGSLVLFFALAYGWMWTCFIPVAAGLVPQPLRVPLTIVGAFGPALAALWVTARSSGRDGVRALLGRVLQRPVAARWILFAVLAMAVVKLTAALLHRLTLGAWPPFGRDPWLLIPVAIAFSTPFQLGEELGWRGFALPRLSSRMGLRAASLVLGAIWAVWHLPQFFIAEGDSYGQSFWVFCCGVVAISVIMAWLFAHVNGSLWPLMLFHSAINNSKDIVPSPVPGQQQVFGFAASPVAWLTLGLLWLCAIACLIAMPRADRIQPRWGTAAPVRA
jgi:membrane protease YdiL (CAAX protease family)